LQHRSYSTDDVIGSGAGVARYFGNFRVAYGFDLARLNGAGTSTLHTAKLGFYPSGRLQFNASVYSGEEAEAILPGVVVTTDVEGMSAGARHALGDRLGLAWWLGSHHQGDLYWRRHVGISLTFGL
jgi:YaiO family outer membrane protein